MFGVAEPFERLTFFKAGRTINSDHCYAREVEQLEPTGAIDAPAPMMIVIRSACRRYPTTSFTRINLTLHPLRASVECRARTVHRSKFYAQQRNCPSGLGGVDGTNGLCDGLCNRHRRGIQQKRVFGGLKRGGGAGAVAGVADAQIVQHLL